jgi:hypothetical protein
VRTLPNVLALLVLSLLSACTLVVDSNKGDGMLTPLQQAQAQEGNEIFRWGTAENRWGQGQQINADQVAENSQVAIGGTDAPKIWRVPRVQNIALYAEPKNLDTTTNLMMRWVLETGTGGGGATLVFDATRFQQVAISAAYVRLSLRFEALVPGIPINPGSIQINAGAYQADGNTSTASARYTRYWEVGASTDAFSDIPEGANSWQVFGLSSIVNQASLQYAVFQSGTALDAYTGDQLLNAHTTGQFIPLIGIADRIRIRNAGLAPENGLFCYQLEL